MSLIEAITAGPDAFPPAPSTDAAGDTDRMPKAKAMPRNTAAGRKPPPETPIDLERVIWDPEYRASVRDRLNRAAPPARRRRANRKAR